MNYGDTIEQTYPVGSVWHHSSYGAEEFTVTGHDRDSEGEEQVLVLYGNGSGPHAWPRGALDQFGTLVRNAPQEVTMTSTPRPTIDFSGSRYATAREYAAEADSRVLKDESRSVLQAAARGEEVDAYALNAAVTDAMRSAATRNGQSMGRRAMATRFAHLGHIAQAVLENHADSLPAYDTGERSRLLEEVKPALTEARQEVERLTARLEEVEARRLKYRASADAEVTRLLRLQEETTAKLSEVTAEREQVGSVLSYALERLDDVQTQRVFGYWDGVKA